jgi:hypothetical protein
VAKPKFSSQLFAVGTSGPRRAPPASTKLLCQALDCTAHQDFQASGLVAATVVARDAGWDVSYDGPGQGWIQLCPKHARQRI